VRLSSRCVTTFSGQVLQHEYSNDARHSIFDRNYINRSADMNIQQVRFVASERADLDWQAVGANENPYSAATQPETHKAYDDRFEQIRFEWEQFTGSVA
jgi:hypothetical protein